MKKIMTLIAAMFLLIVAGAASGETMGDSVQVEIRNQNGRALPFYPTALSYAKKKVYAEAVKGSEYTIFVRNLLPRRVGLVVAVDGRNIISGKKSWLGNNERMYILGPYESCEYRGWRTGSDRVNRFFFTEAIDSYAAAFGDQSAMGVIAVAVYPEVQRQEFQEPPAGLSREQSGAAAQVPKAERGKSSDRATESAGTGYGREEHSPSRVVAFDPEANAVETILIKYEWRATLCRMGIVCCKTPMPQPNRLWDDGGYAPPPPRRG